MLKGSKRSLLLTVGAPLLSAALVILVVFRSLVFQPGYLIYRDLYPGQFLYRTLWHALGSFLALENYKFITYTGLFSPLLVLGLDVFEKAVYLGAVLVAYLAAYWALYRLLGYLHGASLSAARRHLVSILGAVVFVANPAAVNIFFDFSLYVGYAFSPLILLIYGEMLAGKRRRGPAVLLVAGLWWLSAIKAHWIVFGGLLLLPPLLAWLVYHRRDRQNQPYWPNILSTGAIVLLYLLLSAYWLVPFLQASQQRFVGSYAPMTYESVAFLSYTPWTQVARLLGLFQAWPYVAFYPPLGLLALPWNLAGWLLPLLAAAGFIWHRRFWPAWTLAIIAVGGGLLAKGVAPPLGQLYNGLVFGPLTPDAFRWLFRVASKWNVFVSLGLSGLVTLALAQLLIRVQLSRPIYRSAAGSIDERRRLAGLFPVKLANKLPYWPDRRAGLALAALLVFALAFPLFAWPSFSGDLNGALDPVELPEALLAANRWLAGQEGDYKVNWMPVTNGRELSWNRRPSGGLYTSLSALPSIATTWNRHPVLYYSFAYDSVANERTADLGRLLSILNTRYVAYHDDVVTSHIHEGVEPVAVLIEEGEDKLTGRLDAQRDLRLAWQEDFLSIYEASQAAPPLFVPRRVYLATADLTLMNSLSGLASFSPQASGLLFDASRDWGTFPAEVDGLLLGRDGSDSLVMAGLPAEALLSPAEFTQHGAVNQEWSRFDIYQFDWQSVLREHQIYHWGFDYGQNMAAHTDQAGQPPARLIMPVEVKAGGRYHLWIRYLRHPRAGELLVTLDDREATVIEAGDPITGFEWQELGAMDLAAGEHQIALENRDGFMAVNTLALIEEGELTRLAAESRELATGVPNLYWLEAENDFVLGKAQASRQTPSLSGGRGVELAPGSPISTTLDLVTPGGYSLALRLSLAPAAAPLTVTLPTTRVVLGPSSATEDLAWVSIGPLEMAAGPTPITLEAAGPAVVDALVLTSGESGSPESWFEGGEPPAIIDYEAIDPTRFRVLVRAERPFTLALAETYDPLWTASGPGFQLSSRPLYGVINGFAIEQTGSYEIVVEYQAQQGARLGALITAAAVLALIPLGLVRPWMWSPQGWGWSGTGKRSRRPRPGWKRPG